MPQGTIKKLVGDRGFGFISGDHGDVFFHFSSVEGIRFEELELGQVIQYELDADRDPRRRNKRPRASLVRLP